MSNVSEKCVENDKFVQKTLEKYHYGLKSKKAA
jgi:hypothetical protein